MRQRDPLSLDEARELDALERALAGDPVDTDLREFEDLVHDIRATAPQMTPGFAARLEHELAEGFPHAREAPPARRAPRRWMLLPAVGSLAAVAVALVVVLGQHTSDPISDLASKPQVALDGGAPPPAAADRSARESAPAAGAQSSGGANQAADPAPSAKLAPQAATALPGPKVARRVQRSAELVLRVSTRRVASTSDGVIRTVDRFGGIVASSTSASDDSTGEATFDLRIPTERLDEALAALSKLGHVAERRQNLVDITGSFTSAQDRLSDARAERRGLLRALGRASSEQHIDSLRARLRNARSQIARLNGELDALRRRADLSRVSLTVRGDGTPADEGTGSGSWSPGDAARDAVRVLEVIAGVLLIALAVAGPLAVLAAIAALGVRAGRRRRREGALDAA